MADSTRRSSIFCLLGSRVTTRVTKPLDDNAAHLWFRATTLMTEGEVREAGEMLSPA